MGEELAKTPELTIKDQIKLFGIKAILGYQTILVFGVGRKLGIFDYLFQKALKTNDNPDMITEAVFTPEEVIQNCHLDPYYFDAWIQMAIEVGIFIRDPLKSGQLRTAPHLFTLLVYRDNPFYIGNNLAGFYMMAEMQPYLLEGFQKGTFMKWAEIPKDFRHEGNKMSASMGLRLLNCFDRNCRDHKKTLRKGGAFLEVGCGFGINLANWAKTFKASTVVGLDIDKDGVEFAQEHFKDPKWTNRVEILGTPLADFAPKNQNRFDVVMLNQVLHEMSNAGTYRHDVIEDIYRVLKPGGLLIVGEDMMSPLFGEQNKYRLFETMHKWLEAVLDSHFYDKEGFKSLIASTSFGDTATMVQEGGDYCWTVIKSAGK